MTIDPLDYDTTSTNLISITGSPDSEAKLKTNTESLGECTFVESRNTKKRWQQPISSYQQTKGEVTGSHAKQDTGNIDKAKGYERSQNS